MEHEDNKDILNDWLKGKINDEEAKLLLGEDDYKQYKNILSEVDQWTVPKWDGDALFERIQTANASRKKTPEPKVVPIGYQRWIYGLVASVLLLVGFSMWWMKGNLQGTRYETAIGETKKISLPDGSVVTLSGNSSILLNEDNFAEKRVLNLEGKAFFEVTSGEGFEVIFPSGHVKVLGTKFTVTSGKDAFDVRCFEGKVSTTNKLGKERILTQGMGANYTANAGFTDFVFEENHPVWMDGFTQFRDTPLPLVLQTLQSEFGYTFQTENISLEKTFTGRIPHSKPELALKLVFESLGIGYEVDGKVVVLR